MVSIFFFLLLVLFFSGFSSDAPTPSPFPSPSPTSFTWSIRDPEALQYYLQGVQHHSSTPQLALQYYSLALSKDWSFPEAHQNLAILLDYQGKYEEAKLHYQQSYQIAQEKSSHHLLQGNNGLLLSVLDYQITAKLNLIAFEMKYNTLEVSLEINNWIEECESLRNLYLESQNFEFQQQQLQLQRQQQQEQQPQVAEEISGQLQPHEEEEFIPKEHIELLFNLGLLYQRVGNYYKAIKLYEKVLNLNYFHILSWLNIGNYFFQIRDFTKAIEYYEIALKIVMELLEERKKEKEEYGNIYHSSYLTYYYHVLAITNNLGQSYREQGQLRQSLRIFQLGYEYSKILTKITQENYLDENNSMKENDNLNMIMKRPKRISRNNLYLLITIYTVKGLLNHWKEYEYLEEIISQQIQIYREQLLMDYLTFISKKEEGEAGVKKQNPFLHLNRNENENNLFDPYSLSLMKYSSAEVDFFICQQNCPMNIEKQFILYQSPHRASPVEAEPTHSIYPTVRSKIRIGFLSYDWRDHPMGRLTAGLVTNQFTQTASAEYETYCFMYGFNDRSDIFSYVHTTCQYFIDLFRDKNDFNVAKTIFSYNLDILIDITSHTYHNRMSILSFRPAPILINYLGFPGTTGCLSNNYLTLMKSSELDNFVPIEFPVATEYNYTILDINVAPPDYLIQRNPRKALEKFQNESRNPFYRVFSEKIIFLPFTYQSNYMPLSTFSSRLARFNNHQSFPTLNLCVLNANKKFEPLFFHTLTNLLQRFYSRFQVYFLDVADQAKDEIRKQLAFYGIFPSRKRITYFPRMSWKSHLQRIQETCDFVLDSFVYGGHTTSTDVLWMGIPIITLRGFGLSSGIRMPSRVASSLLDGLDRSLKEEEETDISSKNDLSQMLSYDTIKGIEEGILRFLFPRGQDKDQRDSTFLLKPLKQRILNKSCFSPIFYKHLMNKIFTYQYQILHEHNKLFDNGLIDRRLNFILTPLSARKLSSTGLMTLSGSYCLDETKEMLQNTEGRTKSFHGKFNTTKEINAWISRLNSIPEKALRPFEKDDLVNFRENLKKLFISQFLSNFALENLNLFKWEFIIDPIRVKLANSLNLEDLYSFIEDCLLFIRYCNPNEMQQSGAKDTIKLILVEIYDRLISLPSSELKSFYLQETFDLILRILKVPRLLPMNLQKELKAIHNQSSPKTLNKIILKLFTVQWSVIPTKSQEIYQLEILKVFSYFYPILFNSDYPFYKGLKIPLWSRSRDENDLRLLSTLFEAELQLVQKEFHDIIEDHSEMTFHLAVQQLKKIFSISYQLIILTSNDFSKLFNFGIHWNGFISSLYSTYPTANNQNLFLLFGYIIQAIGNQLILSQKRISFLKLTYENSRDYESHQSILTEKEQPISSLLQRNPTVIFYCYEYGQEWWPGWGPSSLPDSFHHPEIPVLFGIQNKLIVNETEKEELQGSAMGGSEEAVAYLSYELAKEGYNVEIYTDILMKDRFFTSYQYHSQNVIKKIGRVRWFHYLDYNITRNDVDIFISWRYALSISLTFGRFHKPTSKRYLWLHDLVPKESLFPLELRQSLDGILVQSPFHQDWISQEYELLLPRKKTKNSEHSFGNQISINLKEDLIFVLPNGIHRNPFMNLSVDEDVSISSLKNDPNIFIYASSPNRGLEIVLKLWPSILALNPFATLHIFYGFTQKVIDRLTHQFGKERFDQWFQDIQVLLNQSNVFYYGSVSHSELYRFMSSSGFLLYPSSFPETGCITMMKAMISGVIPITSRYQSSVLATLGGEFDFGPGKNFATSFPNLILPETLPLTDDILSNASHYHDWLVQDYLSSIQMAIELSQQYPEEVKMIRSKMIRMMGKKYLWKNSVEIIEQIFQH